jgi:hypothetical protein
MNDSNRHEAIDYATQGWPDDHDNGNNHWLETENKPISDKLNANKNDIDKRRKNDADVKVSVCFE